MILEIDKDSKKSGYCILVEDDKIIREGEIEDDAIFNEIIQRANDPITVMIDVIDGYHDDIVGQSIFDTYVWMGRLAQLSEPTINQDVEGSPCESLETENDEVKQKLIDRFIEKDTVKTFKKGKIDICQAFVVGAYNSGKFYKLYV